MKNNKIFIGLILLLFLASFITIAEARVGSGRSSGFRGSRGFSPTPRYSSPSRNTYTPSQPQQSPINQAPSSPSGGSFMRGLMGGVAGGFLGSMLARTFGYGGGMGMDGAGGSGIMNIILIILLAGVGIYFVRKFTRSKPQQYYNPDSSNFRSLTPQNTQAVNENDFAETLNRYDVNFNLTRFKEDRMDDFLKIQSSWNTRDLGAVSNLIAPEIRETLEADIRELKKEKKINKLENIAVRGSDLTESWQENGKEFATLNFRAQLLDYTIDETTQSLVSGDRSQPVRFEEEWTFVRNLSEPASTSNPWKLSAISNN